MYRYVVASFLKLVSLIMYWRDFRLGNIKISPRSPTSCAQIQSVKILSGNKSDVEALVNALASMVSVYRTSESNKPAISYAVINFQFVDYCSSSGVHKGGFVQYSHTCLICVRILSCSSSVAPTTAIN